MTEKRDLSQSEKVIYIYVTHTCRICGRAFTDIDSLDTQNVPPTYRACEKCVKDGHKYEDKKSKAEYIKKDSLYSYVSNNTPDKHREYEAFILNKCCEILECDIKKGNRISCRSIFNQANEILQYYLEDNDFSFLNDELSCI